MSGSFDALHLDSPLCAPLCHLDGADSLFSFQFRAHELDDGDVQTVHLWASQRR